MLGKEQRLNASDAVGERRNGLRVSVEHTTSSGSGREWTMAYGGTGVAWGKSSRAQSEQWINAAGGSDSAGLVAQMLVSMLSVKNVPDGVVDGRWRGQERRWGGGKHRRSLLLRKPAGVDGAKELTVKPRGTFTTVLVNPFPLGPSSSSTSSACYQGAFESRRVQHRESGDDQFRADTAPQDLGLLLAAGQIGVKGFVAIFWS